MADGARMYLRAVLVAGSAAAVLMAALLLSGGTTHALPCPDADSPPTPTEVAVTAVPIVVTSTTDEYFVLYVSHDAGGETVEYPVRVTQGQDGTTTVAENLSALPSERYRVEKYLIADPADVDGDCTDDITELNDPAGKNPVNSAAPVGQAAVIISDHETFARLSDQRTGDDYYEQQEGRTRLGTVAYLKFVIDDIETDHPRVYFMNISQGAHHRNFVNAAGLEWNELVRGEMVYQPNLLASDGSQGVYTFFLSPYAYQHSFDTINRAYTLLAANMPLLNNNIALHLRNYELPYSQDLLPLYRSSRINLVYDQDIFAEISFQALNTGNGYGLLRVADPDETPHPNDIVIYAALPNNLARVAGIISTEPQTPLSHVNLRAVQDGVPNAFIRGAVEDTDIAALIGSYVYYKVTETGWTLRAATPEEVASHNANSRPSRVQTPERDLSVTSITPLSSIVFEDWEAFGVKAANLAALKSLSFPSPVADLPNGFAVPFYYYDEFIKANGFYEDIKEMLADPEFQSDFAVQEDKLKKLRKKIKKGDTPDWIETALTAMHATYPEGTSLRYRSSTNNEDLPGFNGAGLYDSKTQHPEETEEDGISKSLRQVYASLWNFEAFTQREFHNVDHLTTAMGVLVHPNYSDELANGVAVSFDPVYDKNGWYYVNTQVGEDLVTNPEAHSAPEEILLHGSKPVHVLATSNLVPQGTMLLSETQRYQLRNHLKVIHDEFKKLYDPEAGERFAMEIEFKITSANILSIKQARPWVFYVAPLPYDNILATGQPVIDGIAQVGRTLSSDESGIADEDGLTNVSYSYQWLRNDGSSDTDISDAVESSYTLTPADALKTVKVRVTFIDDAGYEESGVSDATAQVPAIWTGAITVGNGPEGSGATGYSVFASGMGSITTPRFRLEGVTSVVQYVAYSQSGLHFGLSKELSKPFVLHVGSASFESTDASIRKGDTSYIHSWGDANLSWSVGDNILVALLEAAANTEATGVPSISGTARVGQTLTASTSGISDTDGLDQVVYSYQWVSNDGTEDSDISVPADSTYTLVDADVGKTIKVEVSFTDDAGHEETLTSTATASVEARPNSPATGAPTISGTVQVGETLTASTSGIADTDGLTNVSYSYQWIRNDGATDTDIQDTTGSSYTLVDADVSKTIKVRVSFTDDAAHYETLTSAATASVAARPNSPATGAPTISGTVQVGEPKVLLSPNGSIKATVFIDDGTLRYSVAMGDTTWLNASAVGLAFSDDPADAAEVTIVGTSMREVDTTWHPTWGKSTEVSDRFSEITVQLQETVATQRRFDVVFRAYDDGVAFRYEVSSQSNLADGDPLSERTEFNFADNWSAHSINADGHEWPPVGPTPIDDYERARIPMLVLADFGVLAVHEAGLVDYPQMFLIGNDDHPNSVLAHVPAISFSESLITPWRVLMMSVDIGELLETQILDTLSPTLRVSDPAFVQPGKAIFDWRVRKLTYGDVYYWFNTDAYLHMIDFAAKNNVAYLLIDANWYGPQRNVDSDPLTARDGMDIEAILAHARENGVKVLLYINDVAFDRHDIDTVFGTYSEWGVAGVKWGFVRGDLGSQEATVKAIGVIEAAARHQLIIDIHEGKSHPTGLQRTYPNLLATQFCHSQMDAKRSFLPSDFLRTIFVHMLAGPLDMVNGYFDLDNLSDRENGRTSEVYSTVTTEIARILITYTGLTVLPDAAEEYMEKDDLFEFVRRLPNAPWDETLVLNAEFGEHVTVAKRHGREWFVGSVIDEDGGTLKIDLAFLEPGVTYEATTYENAPDSHYMTNREAYDVQNLVVNSVDVLNAVMAPGGGHAIWLRPMPPVRFTSASAWEVAENNSAVGQVQAGESGSEFSVTGYAIRGGDDGDLFEIDDSGMLAFKSSPDFEQPADATLDNEYTVIVEATGELNARTRTATQTITVTVTDTNEVLTVDGPVAVYFAENSNAVAALFTASDPEGQPVEWSLAGADSSEFEIVEGSLRFLRSPNYEAVRSNVYQVVVQASDSTHTAVLDVAVTVTDVDESGTGSEETTDRPHGLTATVSENAITLTWHEPDNFYGPDYHILRHRPEEGEPKPLVYVDFTETDAPTFTDTDVEPGVLYVYQVRATIDVFSSLSEPSDPLEVRMPEESGGDTPRESNTPAIGAPTIRGTAQVGKTLTADMSGISDEDGLDNAVFTYQWLADNADISVATGSTYILADADVGKTIKVRVTFTDDGGHEETLTSAATSEVAAAPSPLTVSLENNPASHNGADAFTFRIRFSEELKLSYKTLRDHAFTVTGGEVVKARRLEPGKNVRWEITVRPDSNGAVTIVLPATENCDADGAICTEDGRSLSNELEITVTGPDG